MLRSPSCENSLDSHHSLPVLKERTVSQEEDLQLTAGPWADTFSWASPICTRFWVQPSLTTSPTIIFIGPLYSNVEAQERTAELDTETNASISCVKAIVPILLSREESRGLQMHHLLMHRFCWWCNSCQDFSKRTLTRRGLPVRWWPG